MAGPILMDLSKAFDCLPHDLLMKGKESVTLLFRTIDYELFFEKYGSNLCEKASAQPDGLTEDLELLWANTSEKLWYNFLFWHTLIIALYCGTT